jgi:hypothetical protein
MPGFEGVEREDYDEREAGIGKHALSVIFRRSAKAETTKGTKVHEGNLCPVGLTLGFTSVE